MGGLLLLMFVILALAAFGALALAFGVDSRPEFGDERGTLTGLTV